MLTKTPDIGGTIKYTANMEQNYLTVLAEKRQAYEEKRAELEAQRTALGNELKALKTQFDDERKTLDRLYNHPTKHSIAVHRRRNGYAIRHYFAELLKQLPFPYINGEEAKVGFNIEEDKLTFSVEVPFKHSAYEDYE